MRITKKVLSMLLVIVMVLSLLPVTAFATGEDTVYISISDDAQFVTAPDGTPMGFYGVTLDELATIDLDTYGLGDYAYDADGDGAPEIVALHLYIYVHEEILGLDWSDVYVSGSAGSIYFAGGLFGFCDENLRYDLNGAYPAVDGWGLTADQIVLSDGDFINVAHYTDWAFWGDSATGFHYFTDIDGNLQHTYELEVGETLELGLVRSYFDWNNGGLPAFDPEIGYEIYYGKTYGDPEGRVYSDEEGMLEITFPSAGTWYVWADGGYGMENPEAIVSAPAFAKVVIKEDANQVAANAVMGKINAIGSVTLEKEDLIAEVRAAYNALSDTQKAMVSNYTTLTAAEEKLQQLKDEAAQAVADQTAADAVEEQIAAIGTVTVFSGKKIDTARAAFDALTDTQKALVDNVAVLTTAESALTEAYKQAAKADHKAIFEATGSYIAGLGTPSVGSVGGEWMVIDLTRGGQPCPEGYYQNVVDFVKTKINDKQQLHRVKSTENSRVILALTAAGYDVTDVAGHNLLMGLTDMTYIPKQGINGPIWALLAFDSHNYEIPVNPNATEQATREKLIAYILDKQLADGGWALSGQTADPDMTGMAIQALAPYYKTNDAVKAAVDEALVCLSNKQMANGGFGSIDGICTESCAQVVVALTALGIDPETDARFIKNGISVLDAMCLFAVEDGGFAHIPAQGINGMATEQGQYALAAYFRFKEGKTSLYNMTDVMLPGEAVSQQISTIGTVTLESEKAIIAARVAYDALSDYQKTLVNNYDVLTAAEVKLHLLKNPGKVENITNEKDNACMGKLDISVEALADKLLTKEEEKQMESGVNISIELNVEDISKNVPAADKALVEEILGESTLGVYLDITLTKQFGDAKPVKITETNGAVTVTIVVPENLRNTDTKIDRTYNVVRVHEGKTDILDAVYDAKTGELSFQTDCFSTYALVYTDTAVAVDSGTHQTGDNTPVAIFAILMVTSAACLAVLILSNKKKYAK